MELPINLDDHFVGNIFLSATVLIAKDRYWSKHERLEKKGSAELEYASEKFGNFK